MAWGSPQYTNQEYNLAGKVLATGSLPEMSIDTALSIINNWRSSHYRPLDTFQLRLRRKSLEVDSNSLVAQRIKRLYSIRHKIERFPTMRLTQIQDIAGCRAIVSTPEHLEKLVSIMTSRDKKRSSRGIKHKLVDEKDYVKNPKLSGYRGVHLVFKYHSDKVHDYDGLKIELQFRTYIQHAWATAVETVGIFIGQALKSSIGEEKYLRFFALVSSAMAAYEGTPLVPNINLTLDDIRTELRQLNSDLGVESHLRAYRDAMSFIEEDTGNAHYYLLELDIQNKSIKVIAYKQNQFEQASEDYLNAEKENQDKNVDAVLVSADSIATLKKAYPNYFVDTDTFITILNRVIS